MSYRRKKSLLVPLITIIAVIAIVGVFCGNTSYKYLSQKTFEGTVDNIEKLNPGQILTGKDINNKVFSFSLSVDVGDEFVTFSSEDRQFAAVIKGDRIKFKVFRYAPWDFEKGGTFYGGRLIKRYKHQKLPS